MSLQNCLELKQRRNSSTTPMFTVHVRSQEIVQFINSHVEGYHPWAVYRFSVWSVCPCSHNTELVGRERLEEKKWNYIWDKPSFISSIIAAVGPLWWSAQSDLATPVHQAASHHRATYCESLCFIFSYTMLDKSNRPFLLVWFSTLCPKSSNNIKKITGSLLKMLLALCVIIALEGLHF